MKLKTSNNIQAKRMLICRTCDKFNKWLNQCKICGCFMDIKTRIAFSKCPIDKWGRELDINEKFLAELKDIFETKKMADKKNKISPDINKQAVELYNRIFGTRKKAGGCGKCARTTLSELRQIYKQYI